MDHIRSDKGAGELRNQPGSLRPQPGAHDPVLDRVRGEFWNLHGVLLTGLTPNSTYYFEVVAETAKVFWIASDPSSSIQEKRTTLPLRTSTTFRLQLAGTKRVIKWKTDESCDSRVKYGTTTPPALCVRILIRPLTIRSAERVERRRYK